MCMNFALQDFLSYRGAVISWDPAGNSDSAEILKIPEQDTEYSHKKTFAKMLREIDRELLVNLRTKEQLS